MNVGPERVEIPLRVVDALGDPAPSEGLREGPGGPSFRRAPLDPVREPELAAAAALLDEPEEAKCDRVRVDRHYTQAAAALDVLSLAALDAQDQDRDTLHRVDILCGELERLLLVQARRGRREGSASRRGRFSGEPWTLRMRSEPRRYVTATVWVPCSQRLLQLLDFLGVSGSGGRIRTCDQLINSQLLYR